MGDCLAESRIHLDVRKLQFFAYLVKILSVKDDKDVALREQALAKLGVEAHIPGPQRACSSLLTLEALDPFDLLLPLRLLVSFLPCSTFLRQNIVVSLAFFLDWHDDRVEFHGLVITNGSINAVDSEKSIGFLVGAVYASRS